MLLGAPATPDAMAHDDTVCVMAPGDLQALLPAGPYAGQSDTRDVTRSHSGATQAYTARCTASSLHTTVALTVQETGVTSAAGREQQFASRYGLSTGGAVKSGVGEGALIWPAAAAAHFECTAAHGGRHDYGITIRMTGSAPHATAARSARFASPLRQNVAAFATSGEC